VLKEALVESAPLQIKPLYDATYGGPLYDPQIFSPSYAAISLPGRITLFFPRGLDHADKGVLAFQWQATQMIYQADRKFNDLSGAIRTLELTEIRPDDAEAYPPTDIIL
jgi:hypothetical protein